MNFIRVLSTMLLALSVGCGGLAASESTSDDPLIRTGGTSAGYSCDSSGCICDKAIENDCEDMSAVCTDDTVDDLINCINGWLTDLCWCRQATSIPPPSTNPFTPPSGVFTRR